MKFSQLIKTGVAALTAAAALTTVPALGTYADEAKVGRVDILNYYGSSEDSRVYIDGAHFEIYKVGDIDTDTGEVKFDSTYEKAGVDLEASDDVLAETLASYAITNESILPTQEGETSEGGKLSFVALPEGAYVLVGLETDYEGYRYSYSPSYFTIPSTKEVISRDTSGEEGDMDKLYHNLKVYPKNQRILTQQDTEFVEIEAIKIWEDENNSASLRPESITVELWSRNKTDGTKTLCDTQKLDASNNWRYVWKDKDAVNLEYYCVEKDVPESYKVSESSGQDSQTKRYFHTFTNSYKPPVTTTETTNPPGTYTKRTVNKTLPYTGMLWWPVPFLAAGGLALVLVGVAGKRRRAKNDD